MHIEIPSNIGSNIDGYKFFNKLVQLVSKITFSEIVFDFNKNTWFEANLCSVFGAILNDCQERYLFPALINLQPQIEDIFNRNHFLASFTGSILPDDKGTTIRYRKNKLTEEKLIKEFLFSELIQKQNFPKLSQAAQKEIIRSIFEIYSNAIIHGNTDYVYSCGQFYPKKNPPRIDFTIVDLGRTIKTNVNEYTQKQFSGIDAIDWAVKEQNSTKPKSNNIPGGLGFKLISDFVRLNKGKLQIISADGFWEQKKDQFTKEHLENEFPGTIVNLEFNLADESFYYLTSEKVDEIIF